MIIEYGITLTLAVGLLIAYFAVVQKREFWLSLLYVSVAVVNLGYLLLSAARSLEFAILANDVVYLGSVYLSLCMLFTVVKLCGFAVKRIHVIFCVSLSTLMFLITATVGFLPWYYETVSLEIVRGAARLVKTYGPLHPVYLVYLLGCFAAMITVIVRSVRKKVVASQKFAGLIAGLVCGNLLVWLFEKSIHWEFEFLSVTYIISELLLLLVYWMMQDYVHVRDLPKYTPAEERRLGVDIATMPRNVKIGTVLLCVKEGETLASREREILERILENKKRRQIAEELFLSENTVKTYTRTLYAKLGVTCREELYALLLRD